MVGCPIDDDRLPILGWNFLERQLATGDLAGECADIGDGGRLGVLHEAWADLRARPPSLQRPHRASKNPELRL